MRKRYQQGSVTKSSDKRYWVGKYREAGKHKTKLLGKIRQISKTEAREELVKILRPVEPVSNQMTVKGFVENVSLPFHRQHWRKLTDESRTDSITLHIIGAFGSRILSELRLEEMQTWLDSLFTSADGTKRMAYTTVDHLRWDLKQIFDLAVAKGIVPKNPVYSGKMLLFVPKDCPEPKRLVMSADDVKRGISALELRERLVFKLVVLAGMRVSEVFGLRRGRIHGDHAEIVERVCRRDVDKPKTKKSKRAAALSSGVQQDLKLWLESSPDTGVDGWLFPSENLETAMGADNLMFRYLRPRLKSVGLGWVCYRVMRRTHSSLMNEQGIAAKLIADQQGHGVDVNQNVYTMTSVESRLEAVESLTELVN